MRPQGPHEPGRPGMPITRMDNVLVVVEDLDAAVAFFVELGMQLEGRAPVEGEWADRVIGIDGVREEVAMLRTPDGHGRIELAAFRAPAAVRTAPGDGPGIALGIRRT